jgi:hypothetical protein
MTNFSPTFPPPVKQCGKARPILDTLQPARIINNASGETVSAGTAIVWRKIGDRSRFQANRSTKDLRPPRVRGRGQEDNGQVLQHSLLRHGPGPARASSTPGPARADRSPGAPAFDHVPGPSGHGGIARRANAGPGRYPGRSPATPRGLSAQQVPSYNRLTILRGQP